MDTILMIEPDPHYRALLLQAFQRNWPQLQVTAVENWADAQRPLKASPDLVISALSLPDHDAPVEWLIKHQLRVVVLVDQVQMSQVRRYPQPQVLDWVVREFSLDYLLTLVQRLMDNRDCQVLLVGEAFDENLLPMLAQMNLQVKQISAQALEHEALDEVNLVLLAGNKDALALLRHIRQDHDALLLPVIVLQLQNVVDTLLLKAGANDLLGTPLSLDALMLRVHNLLNHLAALRRIAHLAVLDPLTQLYNRNFIYQVLPLEINEAHRYGKPLSVMMLDVDHFKQINDTYGHDVGDQALKQVAEQLRQHLREADIACRYGGEEFLVILPQTPLENAVRAAEKIRILVGSTPFRHERLEAPLTLTVSIGVAMLRRQDALDTFIRHADQALYAAKRAGRNRVEVAR